MAEGREPHLDQTVQWARESLQRRRSELQQQKRSLIASYEEQHVNNYSSLIDQDAAATASTTDDDDVQAMLERGRALLAEAEAHSEILGKYASNRASRDDVDNGEASETNSRQQHRDNHSLSGDETRDDFMSTFLHETNHHCNSNANEHHTISSASNPSVRRAAPNLPVESPAWNNNNEIGEGDAKSITAQSNTQQYQDEDNADLQELLEEGEARARLDQLIATVRRQGDELLPKHRANELQDDNSNTPTKRIASFDPSSMKAARRAELKRIKLDEELAAAEEEARMLRSFKALPLPGGVEVKNDLFASTTAFQGKQIGSVDKLVRRDTKYEQQQQTHNGDVNDASSSVSGTMGTFDGMSMVTSRTSHDNSFSCAAYENDADREKAKQLRAEKRMKKKQLLDAVNQIIMNDVQSTSASIAGREDDASTIFSEGCDVVEDPAKLRQDIARLEAKLKQKKTQRLATLNDIVDIDLNALFDRLVSQEKTGNNDVRCIIDRLKQQVCGSVNDFHTMVPAVREIDLDINDEPQQPRQSMYRRHEAWARQREQRLFDARIQLEAEAMDGITGRPQLSHAARSWQRAKESHDEAMKRCAEEEGRKQREKETKEKATNEIKMKEMEELQQQANMKLKSIKSEVNKEEQMKRIELLSKPRQIREVHHNVGADTDLDFMADEPQQQSDHAVKSKIFLQARPKKKKANNERKHKTEASLTKSVHVSDVKPDEFCGKPSFSEMSDREFAKLVKRIEKNAVLKAKESPQKEFAVEAHSQL